MAVWTIKAGPQGQYEEKFLQDGRIYAALPGSSANLAILSDRDAFAVAVRRLYPDADAAAVNSRIHQLWSFSQDMNKGDFVLLVRASRPAIAVGEVTGDYRFEHTAADPFFHWRTVNWLAQQVPRWHFGDDLLLAFSAGLAICPLRRPNADGRIAALRKQGWQPESLKMDDSYDAFSGGIDLEAFARDRMTRQVALCCKKYGAASLVTAVLKRQGGAVAAISDGPESAQLLAAAGPLGFDAPRIFVRADFTQSAAGPQDVQDVLALAEKHQAERALYIAWAGFAPAAMEKAAENFFRLRLWSQDEFIRELCASGAGLGLEPAEFLRLRNIWITAAQ